MNAFLDACSIMVIWGSWFNSNMLLLDLTYNLSGLELAIKIIAIDDIVIGLLNIFIYNFKDRRYLFRLRVKAKLSIPIIIISKEEYIISIIVTLNGVRSLLINIYKLALLRGLIIYRVS